MKRLLFLLLGLGLMLGAEPALALQTGMMGYVAEPGIDARAVGLHCDHSTDDTATLKALLETGALSGKNLWLPPGCVILLGTPSGGAGTAVASLTSNTVIEGADEQTSGFALARKRCVGGDTPGGACSSSTQCPNSGTCSFDNGVASVFAPTAGSTYTVFGAASGSSGIRLSSFSVWADQESGDEPWAGGTGKPVGYCTGGTSDGRNCQQYCTGTSGGSIDGLSCNATTDYGSTCTVCSNLSHCKSGGGTCGQPAVTITTSQPSGPGKINVIDLTNATTSIVNDIQIYGLQHAGTAVKLGQASFGERIVEGLRSTTALLAGTSFTGQYGMVPDYSVGMYLSPGTTVRDSTAYGWDTAFYVQGDTNGGVRTTSLSYSKAYGLGGPTLSGWNGTVGATMAGQNSAVTFSDFFTFMGAVAVPGGNHYVFKGNTHDNNLQAGVKGPCFTAIGPHVDVLLNRCAWATIGNVITFGEQRGLCSAGSRSGLACLASAGTTSLIGCPSSTCGVNPALLNAGGGHTTISNNLIHSDTSNANGLDAYIGVTPFGYCDSTSTLPFKSCTTNNTNATTGCPGSSNCGTLCCTTALTWPVVQINDNNFYAMPASVTGINLNAAAVFSDVQIRGNLFSPTSHGTSTTGIKFPSTVANLTFADVSSDFPDVTTPLSGWDGAMGTTFGSTNLLPASDDVGIQIPMIAGGSITRGMLVSGTTTAYNVVTTTTANTERALGVALSTVSSTATVLVMTSGETTCIAQGSITAGDLLKPSTTTAGSVASVTSSSDPVIGTALETKTNTQAVRCTIGTGAAIQNNTTVFPKFDRNENGSPATLTSSCATNTALATLTYSTTSGRTVRLQTLAPVNQTTAASRTATVTLKRGGSSCDSGATTLETLTTAVTSTNNTGANVMFFTDTGQSGSVTYRLCGCSNGAGTTTDIGSAIHVTEY